MFGVAPVVFIRVGDDTAVATDIIGGIDPVTGKKTGLELINSVFPKYRLVPGQIVAPKFSADPSVAAVMQAKANSINGLFKSTAVIDLPESVTKYSDAPDYKNTNNLTDEEQIVCFGRPALSDKVFWMSSQYAALTMLVDSLNEDVPYMSPSNHNLQMNKLMVAGSECFIELEQANYLNGNGIITALNWIGGWKAWGNRTGCYPSVTDPKDAFIPIRRMFNWIGNEQILTYWQKVDSPMNKRLIQTILESFQTRLDGLTARQFILGGRVVFEDPENPVTDLMNGIIRFHNFITPPPPAKEIHFINEFDPQYFETLFS